MTKANECTCPSGDGSLAHPCPAHPAVEQVGANVGHGHVFPRADGVKMRCGGPGLCSECAADASRARAALAQPSPVRSSLLINGYQLRAALEFIAPDGTAKQLESEARIEWRQQDADFLEAGLYAWCAEYPEEGCVLLDEEPATAQPSPAQAEQAEAERPEVVAVMESNGAGGKRLAQRFPIVNVFVGDELMTVAQHAASVARWAEMFNRFEQERDAALSRVAELEKQEPSGWLAYYFGGKRNGKIYGGPCGTKEEIDRYIQHVERSDDSISLQGKPFYAAPVAQAQHSVPEGWMLVPVEPLLNMMSDKDHDTRITAERQLLSILAAAPGKEG